MKISVKKIILTLTVLLGVFCFVVGCDQIGATNVTITRQTGAIGAFELTTPAAGESVYALPVFKWTAAQNADTYEFEIASSEEFSQTYDSVYVKKTGITDTQITSSHFFTLLIADEEVISRYPPFYRICFYCPFENQFDFIVL